MSATAAAVSSGPGRLDVRRSVRRLIRDAVVVAGVVAGLQLGLRHGGLERDVPQRRRILAVRLAAGQVAQERALARRLRVGTDRRVRLRPVDRQAERAPQALEDLLVLHDQLVAEVDEVTAADRDLAVSGRDLPAA